MCHGFSAYHEISEDDESKKIWKRNKVNKNFFTFLMHCLNVFSNFMFDLFDLTNKVKDLLKTEGKNGQLIREISKEKSRIISPSRSDSKKPTYTELNNKTFGGMFVHGLSKEQDKIN